MTDADVTFLGTAYYISFIGLAPLAVIVQRWDCGLYVSIMIVAWSLAIGAGISAIGYAPEGWMWTYVGSERKPSFAFHESQVSTLTHDLTTRTLSIHPCKDWIRTINSPFLLSTFTTVSANWFPVHE